MAAKNPEFKLADDQAATVLLAGPIKHWWNENWGTPEHVAYDSWREMVCVDLVDAGYLVYCPHRAFKGKWTEKAQAVNDAALRLATIIVNLTPPGVPSQGTDAEMLYAHNFGSAIIVEAPPVEDTEAGLHQLRKKLFGLLPEVKLVEQREVLESLLVKPHHKWMIDAACSHYLGHEFRIHHTDENKVLWVTDTTEIIEVSPGIYMVTDTDGAIRHIPIIHFSKIEILAA